MSTILEGQYISWRTASKPRERVPFRELARVAVIVVAVAAAVVYMATMSQTRSLVVGLLRENAARTEAPHAADGAGPSAMVVTLRPSARDGRPLLP